MKERKGIHANISKVHIIITVFAAIIAFLVLLMIGMTDKTEGTKSRMDAGYMQLRNVACQEITDEDTPIGVKKVYSFTIDDRIDYDTYLAFYTVHQYVEVRMEGKKISSLVPSDKQRVSKTVGSNWTLIPIYREDEGKQIQILITPVYESFRNREVEFLLGSELAIYKDRLRKDLPQLILSIATIFVGLVYIGVAGYNQFRKQRGKGMIALGIFSVMLGIWRLTDTRFTPFLFPKQSVLLFYLSVTMLMLGNIPLMKWLEEYFTEKSRKILNGYCVLVALNCVIQYVLQLTGIKDIREMLLITHVVIATGVLLVIGIAVYERVAYPGRLKSMVGNKLPYICVAGVVADVVAFYVKGNSSGLLFTIFAFLLYIVITGVATLFNYSEQELQLAEKERQLAEKDRELAEKERKLTDRRIASMMSQIRSHFIFNVLTTISGYCKIDPKKADETLIRFSRYLRKNIRIIEEEGLIDFDVELEQLEDYVALEQLRFEDMIVFEKELEVSNFQIPPLTIQPIVENAIKHGLIEHNRSGVIWLATKEQDGMIVITVTDDGVGFLPDACENSQSVGIRNVRFRLENMVDGQLDVESAPGQGTKVTIRIPVTE
ncbi:MAG: sensor histidine kinase [Lachnospiraceae bacterium]